MRPSYRLGVDIGGTFTDLVMVDEETGEMRESKAFTTPEDFSKGFAAVIEGALPDLKMVSTVVHGSTVGVNAVVTRSGGKVGIITTYGFRDRIEMGNAWRPVESQYDPKWVRPIVKRPLVPRYLRRTVNERVVWDGSVFIPLDKQELMKEARFLVEQGVEAIVICFLNSIFNTEHELKAKKLIKENFPGIYVCASSEVTPVIREYSRLITGVLDAYITPPIVKYFNGIEKYLKERGYGSDLLVMNTVGGVMTSDFAKEFPVNTLSSGPVGGVAAARYYGQLLDEPNLITLDMGGTTCDISVIRDYMPYTQSQHDLEWDLYAALPFVDINSIGAGGGSILWIDRGGALRVGPQSAGARPGPICYDFGGTEPTITDAYAVLGMLLPEYFLGGKKSLNISEAREAMEAFGKNLNVTAEDAATSAIEIQNAAMTEALREVSIYRGFDPRDFCLLAFGSAGPMVGSTLGKELGVKKVIIPKTPGEFSALGMIYSDVRVDRARSIFKLLPALDLEQIKEYYGELERDAREAVRRQGIPEENITMEHSFDGQYFGQTWDTPASVPFLFREELLQQFEESFTNAHERLWGYKLPGWPIRIVTVRVTAYGSIDKPSLIRIDEGEEKPPKDALVGGRRVYGWKDEELQMVPIYRREKLLSNNRIDGPAIIVQETSTTLLNPADKLVVDDFGNFIITYEGDR